MPGTERFLVIDALRGIAALFVTWLHVTYTFPKSSWVLWTGSYGWVGVEIFFVISGFIIPWSMHRVGYRLRFDWYRFIAKRLARLEPPYLVSIILSVGLLWAGSAGVKGDLPNYSIGQVVSHLGYLTQILGYSWINMVYWTLAVEFQFYLFMALTFPLWTGLPSLGFFVAAAVLGALALARPAGLNLVSYAPLFMFGIAAFRFRNKIDGALVFFGVLATATVCLLFSHGRASTVAGLGAALLIAFPPRAVHHPWLLGLGAISFSLYLVHVPVGGGVVGLMRGFGDTNAWFLLSAVLALGASLLAAGLFYVAIERPAMRWASRIRFGSRPT